MKTKKCGTCGNEIDANLFNKNVDGKDGLRSNCRACDISRRKKYKAREKLLKLAKEFPECITQDSGDKAISDLYYSVQMDNLANGYTGVNANNPNAKEVDHIIPITKGGLHTMDNLQVLTVHENRSKKAKESK